MMTTASIDFNEQVAAEFKEGVEDRSPVSGLTHTFYNYPARFSPLFARAAIKAFTKPSDLVFDPFMGGGTSLVEACFLGRNAAGTDISSLATFISQVKTTVLSDRDISGLLDWAIGTVQSLNLHRASIRPYRWIEQGYQKNISDKKTWAIRKAIELMLAQLDQLPRTRQRQFARCAILKTAQWALDRRSIIPSASEFRRQFLLFFESMIEGAVELANGINREASSSNLQNVRCLNRSVIGIEQDVCISEVPSPKLILTSPPYPGVHVLYHRWQIGSSRETPAPFWIANCLDGNGAAHYTFGDRKQIQLKGYYKHLLDAFSSLARISNPDTWLVQLVAFSDPTWQLSKYLQVMEEAGFGEVKLPLATNCSDGRVWRRVPNRKWYARQRGETFSSKEVVLFHRLSEKVS